ncbi:MAG: maleylacetoacetate isomerase [Inhella sp.]|nr:maleylacetoacetate isomerase [Inhella sp.]
MPYTLYSYFRSSASWRVRIALALKGLPADYRGVHLVRKENFGHAGLGAAQRVPALQLADGRTLTQSLAIVEYLDEVHPEPALLPTDALQRALARSLALDIACEIHPLNNLAVLRRLVAQFGAEDAAKQDWMRHWMEQGLALVEQRLRTEAGSHRFALGDTPGLVDCLLVPQVYNAERWGARIEALTEVLRINQRCLAHPAFASTHPDRVPDAE